MRHLPARAGLGFKPEHFAAIRAQRPALGFFEVHAENYMGEGGLPHAQLAALRADYALSLHGVGLSIGGARGLDGAHLARLRQLCDRYEPESFSEHLAWSSHGPESPGPEHLGPEHLGPENLGADYLNDLLPLPYTEATLALVCAHVDQVQEALGRRMLLENPATYVLFAQSCIPETEFLAEVASRTGCGLLLDVNNVFVSAVNHRFDARAYLAGFALDRVGEVHLAGHAEEALPSGPLLIDAHGTPVAEPVWALYRELVARTGPLPTLVEWDNDLPDWPVLAAEAARVEEILCAAAPALAAASEGGRHAALL